MKQLDKSAKILERIRRVSGQDVNVDNLVVYEAIALNTLPIHQRGTIFHGGTFTPSALQMMADHVQAGNGVPLLIMHQKEDLPVGKVFWAESRLTQFGHELRVLFYVDQNETDLIGKLENGSVDEVSVGFLPKHAFCSKCHFDFYGEEATFEHLWTRTDPEGHTIGEEGTHLILDGFEHWYEVSLVGKGAAHQPKIVGRSAAVLDKEAFPQRLAASGLTPAMTAIFATATKLEEPRKMDVKEFVEQITAKTTEIAQLTAKNAELEGRAAALADENKGLKDKIAELEAQIETLKASDEAKLKADHDKLVSKFQDLTKRVLVASNGNPDETPNETDALIEKFDRALAKLGSLLPLAGGVALAAVTGSPKMDERGDKFKSDAFKVKK